MTAEFIRREFLGNVATGLYGVGLLSLLQPAGTPARGEQSPALGTWTAGRGATHHPPKAKRVLQIFCPGAASHIDLWDHKPALETHSGTPLPGEENGSTFQGKNGNLMASPWPFQPYGQSGKRLSSLLPNVGQFADDIAFLHGMTSKTNTHGPGCIFVNSGHVNEGFPAAGAWASYALGSANENLPAYVAIPDVRGEPPNGKANWSNGFLPAVHQGVMMGAQLPLRNLAIPAGVSPLEDRATRESLLALNALGARERAGASDLAARISAYQLAARMQLSAPEVCDLSRESEETHRRYGTNDSNLLKAGYARNCLLSRRLLEQGVRYVSLYCASRASGVDGLLNWDAHKTLKEDYDRHAPIFDGPTAALLEDLKQSGLLEDTLVLWTTEFGRMPMHQMGTTGRDHNPDGFTCWMMGAGIKPGVSYGATDEFGRRAVENITTVWDFYATVLHLLGFDHEQLTWYYNGLSRRLTDVHGRVISEILT